MDDDVFATVQSGGRHVCNRFAWRTTCSQQFRMEIKVAVIDWWAEQHYFQVVIGAVLLTLVWIAKYKPQLMKGSQTTLSNFQSGEKGGFKNTACACAHAQKQ
jgi:hypothetical protein